jgi:hypothetical protein
MHNLSKTELLLLSLLLLIVSLLPPPLFVCYIILSAFPILKLRVKENEMYNHSFKNCHYPNMTKIHIL